MLLKEFRLIRTQPGLAWARYSPLGSECLTAAAGTTARWTNELCEANLAATWYWLWQIKCYWQQPRCSVAIPHWHNAWSHPANKVTFKIETWLFELLTMEAAPCMFHRGYDILVFYVYWWKWSYFCPCEINQCFARWTKHFYLLHP